MTADVARLPRVLTAAPVDRVESRAPVPDSCRRIAFLAHWSPAERQSRSTTRLVADLQRSGYAVIVCSTSPAEGRLDFAADADVRVDELTVLRRPNTGYDFGSWAVAMAEFEHVLDREHVLVLNDSLVGPFAPLDRVIAHFERSTADIWGLVESDQFTSHLQSFFRGFRYGVLAEPAMRRFWSDVRVVPDKSALIAEYEFGFTRFLRDNAYSTTAFVHHRRVVRDGLNPTMHAWRGLLLAGVPFVKRELVRDPTLSPDGEMVPQVVGDLYGTTLTDWL